MTKSEAKQYLLKYYKGLMSLDEGLNLIRHYCLDFGDNNQKENVEQLIFLLIERPELFTYCLNYAIKEFKVKYSFVEIIAKKDEGVIDLDKIITIY